MNGARDLGNWVRVAIVLSVFWIIGSPYYLTGANKDAYFQSHSKDCLALQKAPPPGFNLWACGAENRAQWQEARSHMWEGVAQRALGPIALAWLLAYSCARLARRRGAGNQRG
jgi:hypothetical protein